MDTREVSDNRWLTVIRVLKKYDGRPVSFTILDANAVDIYYCSALNNVYVDIPPELALSHVSEYKEVCGDVIIMLEV